MAVLAQVKQRMLLHGITFIGHITSETNGRFGVTPVFNQVIKKVKRPACSYRFLSYQVWNDQPTFLTTACR